MCEKQCSFIFEKVSNKENIPVCGQASSRKAGLIKEKDF